jgi:hypothetical protein
MLGAGVSTAFDFNGTKPPSWKDLVDSLERTLGFDASDSAYQKLSMTQRVEILFRSFLHREEVDPTDPGAMAAAHGHWRELIREHLYKKAPPPEKLTSRHPFMSAMIKLVLQSPMTVTYNFDSFLEESLTTLPTAAKEGFTSKYRLPFESISDVTLPQRRSSALFIISMDIFHETQLRWQAIISCFQKASSVRSS